MSFYFSTSRSAAVPELWTLGSKRTPQYMKAFIFKPTNELIGKFAVQSADQVPDEFQKFTTKNESIPLGSYVEASGKTWTVVSVSPLQLQEGRVQIDALQFVKFECPSCHQHIEATCEAIGALVSCPTCNNEFQMPAETARPKPTFTPTNRSGDDSLSPGAWMTLKGFLFCIGGIIVTVVTYNQAVSSGGGTYVVAWGAILYGGFVFIGGLLKSLDESRAAKAKIRGERLWSSLTAKSDQTKPGLDLFKRYFCRNPDGHEIHGPLTGAEISSQLKSGQFDKTTLVIEAKGQTQAQLATDAEWVSVGSLLET